MKYIFVFLVFGLTALSACKKECAGNPIVVESCDTTGLVVLDSKEPSLRKYVIRNDSTALYGYATAIKSVPSKGEITWVANNSIYNFNDKYYLFMSNYGDNAWYNLEFWAYLRENIVIIFDPLTLGQQKVLDEQSYMTDTTLNYSYYHKRHDDYTEAGWRINTHEENYITVNSIDREKNIIEGEFDLHFSLIGQNHVDGPYAATIRFRCGKFKAKIFE